MGKLTIVKVDVAQFDKFVTLRHLIGLIDSLGFQDELMKCWVKRDPTLLQRLSDNLK